MGRTRSLLFATILLVALEILSTFPIASAISFTQSTVANGLDTGAPNDDYMQTANAIGQTNRGLVNAMSLGNYTFVLVYSNLTSGATVSSRSTDGGASWSQFVVRTGQMGSPNFRRVGGPGDLSQPAHLAGCHIDTTANPDSLIFSKSTDGGIFWTHSTIATIYIASSFAAGCSVGSNDGTTYFAVWHTFNAAGTIAYVNASRSTDGGASWSSPVTLFGGASGFSINAGNMQVLVRNGTTATVLWVHATNNIYTCRTTNGGVNWTTCAIVATGNPQVGGVLHAREYSATQYVGAYSFADNTGVGFIKSNDAGQSWSVGTLDLDTGCSSGGGACNGDGGIAIAPFNATSYGVAYTHTGTSPKFRFAQTNNSGISWTRQDIPVSPAFAKGAAAGIAISNNGRVLAAQAYSVVSSNPTRVGAWRGNFAETSLPYVEVDVDFLTGFDVDRTGLTVIARVENGSHVQSFSGSNLAVLSAEDTPPEGEVPTGCAPSGESAGPTNDRVLAHRNYVAYIVCETADDDDPIDIHIRSQFITDPVFSGCGDCPKDVNLGDFSDDGGDFATNLAEIVEFPIDYSRSRNNIFTPGDNDQRVFGYAWSSSRGLIGVNLLTHQIDGSGPFENKGFTVQAGYASSEPEQICAWESNLNSRQYLGAVDSNAHTRIWEFRANYDEVDGRQEGTIAETTTYPGSLGNAIGLSCGATRVAILQPTKVSVVVFLLSTNGQVGQFFQSTVSGPVNRGVALSGDGYWVSYVSNGEIIVANSTTGSVLANLTMPSGTFRGMRMDEHGGALWVATDSKIGRWDVHSVTTIDEFGFGPPDDDGEDDDGSGGLLGNAGAQFGSALGIGTFGGNLAIAAMIILGMTISGGGAAVGIIHEVAPNSRFDVGTVFSVGGMMGAIAGILVGWAFEVLEASAILAIIVLVAIGFYLYYGGRR